MRNNCSTRLGKVKKNLSATLMMGVFIGLMSMSLAQVPAPFVPEVPAEPLSPQAPEIPAPETSTPEKTPEELEKEKTAQKIKEYNDFLKELIPHQGLFTFYVTKDNKKIYIEFKEGDFGKMWMFQATLYSGASAFPLQAGDPVAPEEDAQAVEIYRWEKAGDQIVLVKPHLKY